MTVEQSEKYKDLLQEIKQFVDDTYFVLEI